ncbi:hypothetical protein CCAN12_730070 [Capnocytophaga canimorsus]|uniref:Uncharacterized protein n=1 Tax=Capnocytophaga canimorsus TaxID=28188 RepID=A0A0B7HGX4_9FLAO|nr:hypothetical protein CCAN12_730070 [Capnocytophaga canimorsus]
MNSVLIILPNENYFFTFDKSAFEDLKIRNFFSNRERRYL